MKTHVPSARKVVMTAAAGRLGISMATAPAMLPLSMAGALVLATWVAVLAAPADRPLDLISSGQLVSWADPARRGDRAEFPECFARGKSLRRRRVE